MLEPGDQILADKGFAIQVILTPIGCELAIPAFLRSKGQFTKKDLALHKQVHNLRVHVERAIGRVKESFHFQWLGVSINCGQWHVSSLIFMKNLEHTFATKSLYLVILTQDNIPS